MSALDLFDAAKKHQWRITRHLCAKVVESGRNTVVNDVAPACGHEALDKMLAASGEMQSAARESMAPTDAAIGDVSLIAHHLRYWRGRIGHRYASRPKLCTTSKRPLNTV